MKNTCSLLYHFGSIWLVCHLLLACISLSLSSQIPCPSSLSAPLVIPIHNVTVTNQVSRRGVALSIGTPSQPLAFEISGRLNNTFVFDAAGPCPTDTTPLHCVGIKGGYFDEGTSSTWARFPSLDALRTAQENNPALNGDIFGKDTLSINSSLRIDAYPVGVTRVDGEELNVLGFGVNSTLLTALSSAGIIASRTWAYFHGWTGANSSTQIDGNLVLGGYDAAKSTGTNLTLPLSHEPDCVSGLVITITNIIMNLKSGSEKSIIGSSKGSALRACISPDYPHMSLPSGIWDSFLATSGSSLIGRSGAGGFNFRGMLISSEDAYDGDLTIALASDLNITIPSHQLVVPDSFVNDQGHTVTRNGSTREVLINSLEGVDENDMPLFGRVFLTSTYLLVDQDHSKFTLWNANVTDTQIPIPIGPPTCNRVIPTTPDSNSTASKNSEPSKAPLSKASIAGIVIAALVLVLLSIAGFVLRRKRFRKRSQALAPAKRTELANEVKDFDPSTQQVKPEMPSDRHPPQELPLQADTPYDLSPYEMGTDFSPRLQELSTAVGSRSH